METNKNALLVGLFVIIAIATGIGFTLWLTSAHRSDTVRYQVRVAESVGGLSIGNAVTFRGVNVGMVEKIDIVPNDTTYVRIILKVQKDTPVKKDTIAILKLQGVTGDIYVDLSGGNPKEPNLAATSKEAIPEISSEPSSITTLTAELPKILEQLSAIGVQTKKLMSDKNINNINTTLHEWQKAGKNLNDLITDIREHPTRLFFGGKEK